MVPIAIFSDQLGAVAVHAAAQSFPVPAGTLGKARLAGPQRLFENQPMLGLCTAPGPGGALQGRYLGKVPKEPWKYSVYYTHFIGNNKVGLEWFCDSLKDWRVKQGDEAVEVTREGDRVNLTFHLVDHEVTLDKPLHITFGLIATPTKPVPLGWEILRFDQQGREVLLCRRRAGTQREGDE